MASEVFSCRLCLTTEGSMEGIFTSADTELAKKIFDCTSVLVKNLAGLPSFICEICKSELIIWLKFRRQCLKSNDILKAKFPDLFEDERQYETSKRRSDEASNKTALMEPNKSRHKQRNSQMDSNDKDESEPDDNIPLVQLKQEPAQVYDVVDYVEQDKDDESSTEGRTILMEIEPQPAEKENLGKRRLTRKSTVANEASRKRKNKNSEPTKTIGIDPSLYCRSQLNIPSDLKSVNKNMAEQKSTQNFSVTKNLVRITTESVDVPQSAVNETVAIKNMVTETNLLILRLTEEVLTIQTELREFKKDSGLTEKEPLWVSRLPCKSKDDFFEFENELNDNEFREQLIKMFVQQGSQDPKIFLKSNIRRIMRDDIGQWFCWTGNKTKFSIGDSIFVGALRSAFHRRFANEGDEIFEKVVQRHYQYAKERLTTRKPPNLLKRESA